MEHRPRENLLHFGAHLWTSSSIYWNTTWTLAGLLHSLIAFPVLKCYDKMLSSQIYNVRLFCKAGCLMSLIFLSSAQNSAHVLFPSTGFLFSCQFCRLLVSTVEQCHVAALERLEADAKLKRQNFGSQSYSPPKPSVSSSAATHPQPPETTRADSDILLKKGKALGFPERCDRDYPIVVAVKRVYFLKVGTKICVWVELTKAPKLQSMEVDPPQISDPLPEYTAPISFDEFNSSVIDRFFPPWWQITPLRQSIHQSSHTIRVACLEGGDCEALWFG